MSRLPYRPSALGWRLIAVAAAVVLAGAGVPALIAVQPPQTGQTAQAVYARLPLAFEENLGQTDLEVRFVGRASGHTIYLTPSEAVLVMSGTSQRRRPTVVRMGFAGASTARIGGTALLPGRVHYLLGRDERRWRRNVPIFSEVAYRGIYPGIDLLFSGRQGRLEYTFVVSSGADPTAIALVFQGVDRLAVDAGGDLAVHAGGSVMRHRRPLAYQERGGSRRLVPARFHIQEGGKVGFLLEAYDETLPLTIDPVLTYSTYLGGAGSDRANGIAVDGAGNAFITGSTASLDFPTANALQPFLASCCGFTDAFVAKLNTSGSALVYATYLGGGAGPIHGDIGHAIAVDAAGNAYVTGVTDATNFPTMNAFQSSFGGTDDAFVVKLNASGSALVYSSYLGGASTDIGRAIAVDAAGNAYVTGYAGSVNFPTTASVFQSVLGGPSDAFVTKVGPTGALVYSTLLGGSASDPARGIALDASGNAYLTGQTNSTNFPVTVGAYQTTCDGCQFFRYDAYVTKLNATGSALIYSTFLGGSIDDFGWAIAVDASGNAYVTGETESSNFDVTAGAFDTTGGFDAFVTKVNASGSGLVYSTYLGGGVTEEGFGITVDTGGHAYITGQTKSGDFPMVDALQSAHGGAGANDAFVTKVNPTGSTLLFSTYLGGLSSDAALGIALDASGAITIAGETFSTNFPTASPLQSANKGGYDAFVAKITLTPTSPDTVTITRALYVTASSELRVQAQSTSATATLTVYATATNQPIGTLTNNGGGRYFGRFTWPSNPQSITVKSNLGGSATRTVSVR